MAIDIDLLVPEQKRSQWLDLGFQLLHGTDAFAQFNPGPEAAENVPVDLMFVDAATWSNLEAEARAATIMELPVRIPRPEHLVALKLRAAGSPTRAAREQDWEDIRQIVRACKLDPAGPYFREIILRFGGEGAMNRIQGFHNEH
jgi:hypothetical protein